MLLSMLIAVVTFMVILLLAASTGWGVGLAAPEVALAFVVSIAVGVVLGRDRTGR